MVLSRKFYNLKASSILESVIALTIISICLYFAIMIFSAVFTPKTSPKFYNTQNKINEFFFLAQLKRDSLDSEKENESLLIEEENMGFDICKISVKYKDTTQSKSETTFYTQRDEE